MHVTSITMQWAQVGMSIAPTNSMLTFSTGTGAGLGATLTLRCRLLFFADADPDDVTALTSTVTTAPSPSAMAGLQVCSVCITVDVIGAGGIGDAVKWRQWSRLVRRGTSRMQ